MTDASPAILSIAMLAAFALVWGGLWLVVKKRDRKRGWLMVVMAIVLLGNVLIWAVPVKAAPPLPRDVARVVERRESCDHWRGEEGYDSARAREIERAVRADCTGTDQALARLRQAYAKRPDVVAALAGYEGRIEP
jgi:thiol:disulfide interchange protein